MPRDVVILSRLVEPYAYYTGKSAWRIDQKYPYVLFFDQFPTKKPVLIVLDESVYRLAPKFAEFVQKNLSNFEIEAFFTGIPFHFGRYRYPEINPVRLYYLPAETLKDLLKKPHLNVLYYFFASFLNLCLPGSTTTKACINLSPECSLKTLASS